MTQDPNAPQPGEPDAPRQPPAYPGGTSPYPAGTSPHPAGASPDPAGGPSYPYPGQDVADSGRPAPPPPVATAVKLMYAGAALSLIGMLSTLFLTGSVRDQIADQPGMDAAAVDVAVTVFVVGGVVVGLVGVGLWILNAVYNARGASWARILSTVLAGLAILFTLIGFVQPQPGLSRVLSILQLLLAAAIVVLLWRPESSRFYAVASAPRT